MSKTANYYLTYALFRSLFAYHASLTVTTCLLSILLGLTQGITILTLIPLLALAGVELADNTLLSPTNSFFVQIGSVEAALLIFLALVTLYSICQYIYNLLLARLQYGYTRHRRQELSHLLLKQPPAFLASQHKSDLHQSFNREVEQIGFAALNLLQTFTSFFICIIYTALALKVSWMMTLAALATAGLVAFVIHPLNKRSYKLGNQARKSRQHLSRHSLEALSGLRAIKSYGLEKKHEQEMTALSTQLSDTLVQHRQVTSQTSLVYELTAATTVCILYFLGVNSAQLSLANFLVLLLILARLLPKLKQFTLYFQNLNNCLPSYIHVEQLSNTIRSSIPSLTREFKCDTRLNKAIHAHALSYRYPNRDELALRNISVCIPAKKTTLIMGDSGSGKSTLIDIIAGLTEPADGQLYIDDLLLTANHIKTWQKAISYVSQSGFLFHDTVRNNLKAINPNADETRMWEVLRRASSEDFIRACPNQLDTIIGDDGARLSGGQRQRLALACALIKAPSVLLLDEATNALDQDSENTIFSALKSLHREITIIIVSHRTPPLDLIDHVIIMKNGTVTSEYDTHEYIDKMDQSA